MRPPLSSSLSDSSTQAASKPIVVMKFGGTSVNSLAHWNTIAELVKRGRDHSFVPVLVLSALAGVSDELEKTITSLLRGQDPKEAWNKLARKHEDFATELGLSSEIIAPQLALLKRWMRGLSLTGEDSPAVRARILSQGEYLLSQLAHNFLLSRGIKSVWVDVGDWLKARHSLEDSREEHSYYLSSECHYGFDATLKQRCLDLDADVVVTQGFIASDSGGKTVLLGRGGSDTSASYLAVKLGAERLEIWTDVPGIFTAHPGVIPSARLLLQLGYDEAQELASSGAKVLHPRCIEPIRSARIPLWIRWTSCPEMKAQTSIGSITTSFPQVKGISAKKGVQVFSMENIGMWHQTGFLADLFAVFKKHRISVDGISTSESNVTVTLDSNSQGEGNGPDKMSSLLEELRKICKLKVYSGCVSISLVGRHIRSILHLLAPVMSVFEDKKVFVVSQAANDLNFSFTVEEKEAERLLRSLHELLFSQVSTTEGVFGPCWHELIHKKEPARIGEVSGPWWQERKRELISLFSSADLPSLYVYHLPTLKEKVKTLKSLKGVDRIFYALKANAHQEIIGFLKDQGLGFDCVSLHEIHFLKKHFPSVKGSSIVFTPNFAPIEEYKEAYDLGVVVTLDNLYLLQAHGEVFAGREVMVRLDPGVGKGHHDHVRTAGSRSKFGVGAEEWPQMVKLCERYGVKVIGLHCHLGSGISSPESWSESAAFLVRKAEELPDLRVLDLGGGFSVPEKPSETPFAMEAFDAGLQAFRKAYPQYEIWAEPGRYLVAESGVLLLRVTQIKRKGRKVFVGVSAGMNALLRPSLYGAYHYIVNLSRLGEPLEMNADVVGPVCESGDVLGYSRLLPNTKEGDILLLAGAGAYGRVMSMAYNMRPFPAERVLEG